MNEWRRKKRIVLLTHGENYEIVPVACTAQLFGLGDYNDPAEKKTWKFHQ